LTEKLLAGDNKNLPRARRWLVQCSRIRTAQPRSKMPVTHLSDTEAGQIAEWFAQSTGPDLGEAWASVQVTRPDAQTLRNLTQGYLDPILARHEIEDFYKGKLSADRIRELPADERMLAERLRAKSGGKEEERTNQLTLVRRPQGRRPAGLLRLPRHPRLR